MDFPAFFFKKPVVNHFLREGMLKNILQIGLDRFGPDKIKALQTDEVPIDTIFNLADPF